MDHQKFLILVFLHLFVSVPFCSTVVDQCDPASLCSVELVDYVSEGTLVPDPSDCHSYYVCIDDADGALMPSDEPLMCPEGQYFNSDPDVLACEDESEAGTCWNTCSNTGCETECEGLGELAFIAHPGNCSLYYVCVENEALRSECLADTPYFSGSGCTDDVNDCCSLCTPYCTEAFVEVMDPYDCYSYYLCIEVDIIPSEYYHQTCESDMYFNSETGKCEEDLVGGCSSLCPTENI